MRQGRGSEATENVTLALWGTKKWHDAYGWNVCISFCFFSPNKLKMGTQCKSDIYSPPVCAKDILQHSSRYYNEARPRERSDRGRFLSLGKKASSWRVVRAYGTKNKKTRHYSVPGMFICLFVYLFIRAKRVSNWYTPQKKSAFLIYTPHKKNLRVCPRARVK